MPKIEITPTVGLVQKAGSGDVAFGLKSTALSGAGLLSTEIAPSVRVSQINDEVVTTIKIDLTGLSYVNTDTTVIGLAAGAAYMFQYSVATHGILSRAEIHCIETPTAASNAVLDFDIESSASGTLIKAGSPATPIVVSGANSAKGSVIIDNVLGVPTDGHYLYLCVGAAPGGADTSTAGKLIIKLFGHLTF
tara:strand:- start:7313 stop:7888 length:576 start_codon:yes stop_codon:yes gene_type:complete